MYCWKRRADMPHFRGLARGVGKLQGFLCAAGDSKLPSQHWGPAVRSLASLAEPVSPDLLGCLFRKEGYGSLNQRCSPTVFSRAHHMALSQAMRSLWLVSTVCYNLDSFSRPELVWFGKYLYTECSSFVIYVPGTISVHAVESEWNECFREWWKAVLKLTTTARWKKCAWNQVPGKNKFILVWICHVGIWFSNVSRQDWDAPHFKPRSKGWLLTPRCSFWW